MVRIDPALNRAQRCNHRIDRVTALVSHHHAFSRPRDVDVLAQALQNPMSRAPTHGSQWTALWLLVVLVWKADALECRAGAGLDDHAFGGWQSAVLERKDRGSFRPRQGQQHVSHPMECLVDDAVVIAIERRFRLPVRVPADVNLPAPRPGAAHAFLTQRVRAVGKASDPPQLVIPPPTRLDHLNGQAEWE